MDELLLAIQSTLREELSYIRDRDIFITPHVAARPPGVKEPSIGIKDGKVDRKYLAGNEKELTMRVRLSIVVGLSKKEASLIGDASAGQKGKGIIIINKECINILDGNFLGIPGIIDARITDDPESVHYVTKEKNNFQRKELGLTYIKQTG